MIYKIIYYVIGLLITLILLHVWKKELNIDNYDNVDNPHNDWDSNAQAYAAWSLGWPIIIIFFLCLISWRTILYLSKWIQTRIEEPTTVFKKRFKVGDLTIKFVLRHYWEKPDPKNIWSSKFEFRTKELGLFYNKSMAIGTKKKGIEAFDKSNLVPSYMFGITLIYVKFWITIDRKVLSLKLES